jgi:MarR family transcriptional regulator for hemolysin
MSMQRPSVRLTSSLSPLARSWRRAVDVALMRFGVSEAIAAPLVHLGRSGGGITQVELAARVGIGGPSLIRLLDRLVASGLVSRQVDPADRRARRLYLTGSGEDLFHRIEAVIDGLRESLLAGIAPEEIDTCVRVLERLAAACDRLDACPAGEDDGGEGSA